SCRPASTAPRQGSPLRSTSPPPPALGSIRSPTLWEARAPSAQQTTTDRERDSRTASHAASALALLRRARTVSFRTLGGEPGSLATRARAGGALETEATRRRSASLD